MITLTEDEVILDHRRLLHEHRGLLTFSCVCLPPLLRNLKVGCRCSLTNLLLLQNGCLQQLLLLLMLQLLLHREHILHGVLTEGVLLLLVVVECRLLLLFNV